MEALRYEYDPCVMDGTVKSMALWVYYDISTTRKPFCVIIFKSDPNKCGNTENISIAWPKTELIFHGVAVTFMLQ
jgi:hypothetical protein